MSDVFRFLEDEYKKNFLDNKEIYNSVVLFLNEPNLALKYDEAVRNLFIMKENIDQSVDNIVAPIIIAVVNYNKPPALSKLIPFFEP